MYLFSSLVKKLEDIYQQEQQLHLQGIVETQEAKLERRKSSTMEDFSTLRRDGIIAQVSFGANVCLFVIKIVASILSGSLSVIASAVVIFKLWLPFPLFSINFPLV